MSIIPEKVKLVDVEQGQWLSQNSILEGKQ